MATSPRRSLVSRAGAAARKVVRRPAAEEVTPTAKTTQKTTKTAQKPAKAPAKKAATTAAKVSAKKTTAAPAKKAPAKKAPAKATKAAEAPAKKAPAKATKAAKAPAKKTPTKAATKTAPTKTATKAAPAKAAATKAAPAKKTTTKTTKAAQKAAPRSTTSKKAPVTQTASPHGAPQASSLVVLAQEEPWTKAELAEVSAQLNADIERLTAELEVAEQDLAGLMRESSDGAGNDQADVGTATFERDQEMTVVHNAREMLLQSQHALERIADGSYGVCENCGNAIGKNRLMAFPRATLCLVCKQREERR